MYQQCEKDFWIICSMFAFRCHPSYSALVFELLVCLLRFWMLEPGLRSPASGRRQKAVLAASPGCSDTDTGSVGNPQSMATFIALLEVGETKSDQTCLSSLIMFQSPQKTPVHIF